MNSKYNTDLADAIIAGLGTSADHEAQEEAAYNEMADRGWLISQDDIAKAVQLIRLYEERREA